MKLIEDLTHEDFEAHKGERFAIGKSPVTLKSVRAGKASHPKFRAQFCLVFEAEDDIGLVADVARLSHPTLGHFDLLVNRTEDPENPDAPPTYEIVLS